MKNNTEKSVKTKIETPEVTETKIEKTKSDAPKTETKKAVSKKSNAPKTKKNDLSKIKPLKVDKKILNAKLEALDKRLTKEKSEFTTRPFHVAFGYFLVKRKSGLMTIEYHENLKKSKWILRDDKGKVLTPEPFETMWKLNEFVNANY